MMKVSAFLTRRKDLSREDFDDYWARRHSPLARSLPEFETYVRRCVRQHAVDGLPPGLPLAPFDGIAELWYDDVAAVASALSSEAYLAVLAADEERFLDRSKTSILVTAEAPVAWPGMK